MDSTTEVAEELQSLHRRWEGITDIPELPRSTMDVIEYGLGKQQRAEVYLNRLLCYLLDPNQPHRMGTDFLDAFLNGLPEACGFDEDTYDLSDVRVNQQVPVWDELSAERDDDASPGYLDLLLEVPNEWFLLIELKFSAEERGTEFYCNATQLGDRLVSEYESGQYYVYMHQKDRPEASGDCFVNWTWQVFVQEVLQEFLAENTPKHPQRTVTQLHDLKDDIQNIAGMSERSDSDHEKGALYLEHVEAISDITETFENEWEAYSERWGRAMQESLDHEKVSPASSTGDGYPAITVDREAGDSERWLLRDSGGDWQHVFKYGWHQREGEPEMLEKRAEDKNDLGIGFYHRMADNRNVAVKDHELRFNFRCMGSNPTKFTDIYKHHFDERRDRIERLLASTRAATTGNKLTLVRGIYPIKVDQYETFFKAYTATLNEAFVELVVKNPELIQQFSEMYDDAVSEYR